MKKQVLTITQMQELKKLGIDTSKASMCWINNSDRSDCETKEKILTIHDEWCYEMSCLDPVPAFTLQDILEVLPDEVKQHDCVVNNNIGYIGYVIETNSGIEILKRELYGSLTRPLIEAAFNLLKWVASEGYLK